MNNTYLGFLYDRRKSKLCRENPKCDEAFHFYFAEVNCTYVNTKIY